MFLPSDETTLVEVSRAIAASLNPASTSADRAGANQALTQVLHGPADQLQQKFKGPLCLALLFDLAYLTARNCQCLTFLHQGEG